MPLLPAAMATLALVAVAAKAHGRQVRIEREQQGVFHVDFGGHNPEEVERIWAGDRRVFWMVMASSSLALFGLAWLRDDWVLAGFALPWAFAAAFTVAGLASWGRMLVRREGSPAWRRRALWGSVAWWAAALAAAALVALTV